jgi:hypothetical protein
VWRLSFLQGAGVVYGLPVAVHGPPALALAVASRVAIHVNSNKGVDLYELLKAQKTPKSSVRICTLHNSIPILSSSSCIQRLQTSALHSLIRIRNPLEQSTPQSPAFSRSKGPTRYGSVTKPSSMMQDRQAEIARKRAKLQELKAQRELRQKEQRGGVGGPGDV